VKIPVSVPDQVIPEKVYEALYYGAISVGRTSVPLLLKANRRIHLLGTDRPFTCAGENFQPPAASRARRAKYLLGPGESKVASTTLPEASTATLTLTRTWP
jgi:hypothetical protein